MTLTHLIVDWHLLCDPVKIRQALITGIARTFHNDYGLTLTQWETWTRTIFADWDDYFADLNFSEDEGLKDYWEGWFRVGRAILRLSGLPEPTHDELTTLARRLPCQLLTDVWFDDGLVFYQSIRSKAISLILISYGLHCQVDSAVQGMQAESIGFDTLEIFEHDATYFQRLAMHKRLIPAQTGVIVRSVKVIESAKSVGFKGIVSQQQNLLEALSHLLSLED